MAEIGNIGDIVFVASSSLVRTFAGYSESASARLGTHDVGGADPVIEFIGPGVRCLEFPVTLNAAMGVDIEADIARAQGYCETGKLLSIAIGGRPIGGAGAMWIIETVDVDRQQFGARGETILANLDLSLKRARTSNTPTVVSSTVTKQNTQRILA